MMQAALFHGKGKALSIENVPLPIPTREEILLEVEACGLCKTDLHIIDGELLPKTFPLILGHQIVGRTKEGTRWGAAWLFASCGNCPFCLSGRENLCPLAEFTGFTKPGGFAEFVSVKREFIYPLPEGDAASLAPLLCSGFIGWRALKKCGSGEKIGFFGFGSSAHLLTQIAKGVQKEIFAFTRPGDKEKQQFAKKLGAVWAGGVDEKPSDPLDAAIIFASAGELVPLALKLVKPGGTVVTAGIEMSPIPSFPYNAIWMERRLESVANLTREDGKEFLHLVKRNPIHPEVTLFSLSHIQEAIELMRNGKVKGSAVIKINPRI